MRLSIGLWLFVLSVSRKQRSKRPEEEEKAGACYFSRQNEAAKLKNQFAASLLLFERDFGFGLRWICK
jgi:hypothetical protein